MMRMNSLLFVVEKKKVVLKLKKLTDGEKRMIKVIAADMDGTLLNPEHTLSDVTYRTILDAQKAGYRFLIATGRDYPSAVGALEKWNLKCDFITGSGAEIRDTEGSILQTIEMDRKWFREIYDCAVAAGGSVRLCAGGIDYPIGDPKTAEQQILEESRLFLGDGSDEEIRNMELFQQILKRIRCLRNVEEVLEKEIPVYKIFITAKGKTEAEAIWKEMERFPKLAIASSFFNNVELTHKDAQKGKAIEQYITSLGYKKDEVMVLGDSMNDLSMFRQGFGAVVAMGNAEPVIREAAGYVTLSNAQDGAAYAMRLLMEGRLGEIQKG